MSLIDEITALQRGLRNRGIAPEAIALATDPYAQLCMECGALSMKPGATKPPEVTEVLGMRVYTSSRIPRDMVYIADRGGIERMLRDLIESNRIGGDPMTDRPNLINILHEAPTPPQPTPTPAATLWTVWQQWVARDPLEAAAWYQTLPTADQATLSALTLAQCAAALTGPPVETAQVAARLRTWVDDPR